MRLNHRILCAVLLVGASFGAGCHRSLEVRDFSRYGATLPVELSRPMSIGIIPVGQPDPRLIRGIVSALAVRRAEVIMPYQAGSSKADVIVTIGMDATHSGSGWNYAVSFPGFLVFISSRPLE